MLTDSEVQASSSDRAEAALIVTNLLLVMACVSLMVYIYTKKLDYEHRRLLMILRFFTETAIRRNKPVAYLLHRYKLFSL